MKISVFSHCTIDSIQLGSNSSDTPGGPACYSSLTAKNLKFDCELFTKFGSDFPKEIFSDKKIILENALSEKLTTRFKITIEGSDRTLSILHECEPITSFGTNSDGVIISPVYHEISNDTYEKIINNSNFIFLDPQGFLRRSDSKKKIFLEHTDLDLSKISAIKTSPDELFCLTNSSGVDAMKLLQKKGVSNVILTNKTDISILVKDKLYSISLPKLELYDTTGIGDIFSATFCCTMLKEKDFLWALCFAGGAAQSAIESKQLGVNKIPPKGAIETNAAYFYNQIKFQQI